MMLRYILLLTIVSVLARCLQTENSSSGDSFPPEDGSELFLEVNEVFVNRCSAPCHTHAFQTFSEEFFMNSSYIEPGVPENSRIYYRIQGSLGPNGSKTMPTVGTITPQELNLIYQWILEM